MHRLKELTASTYARWLGVLLLMLGGLGAAVIESATVTRFDAQTSRAVHRGTTEPVTSWSSAITDLGQTETVLLVSLVAVTVLAAARHWHGILALALSVAVTQATVHLVKLLVSRPRPDGDFALTQADGFSFPSGHAATSMAAYATLTFIAARACGGPLRVALLLAGALVILAVGASRVYLGVHYPTDVLAGWLTGAILVLCSWAVARRLREGAPAMRTA